MIMQHLSYFSHLCLLQNALTSNKSHFGKAAVSYTVQYKVQDTNGSPPANKVTLTELLNSSDVVQVLALIPKSGSTYSNL